MRCVSEYGHVIRVSRILSEIHTHKFHNGEPAALILIPHLTMLEEAGDLRLLNECETRLQVCYSTSQPFPCLHPIFAFSIGLARDPGRCIDSVRGEHCSSAVNVGDVVQHQRMVLFLHTHFACMLHSLVSSASNDLAALRPYVEYRLDNGPHHQEALDIIARIITSLGPRARNSMLSQYGISFAYFQFCEELTVFSSDDCSEGKIPCHGSP